jgi:uncharacterized cupin superfamily protein
LLDPIRLHHHPETDAWGPDTPAPYRGRVVELGQHWDLALGASVGRLPPGASACPLHHHRFEEEIFVVLEGTVTVRELRPGDTTYTAYTVSPGDVVVYPPGTGIAHQSFNRSDTDCRYLALSSPRHPAERCDYPDSGKTLLRGIGIGRLEGVQPAGVTEEQTVEPPPWVVRWSDLPARALGTGVRGRRVSHAAGAREVFVNVDTLEAGAVTGPLHRHSMNDELVLVLSGTVTLEQEDGEVVRQDPMSALDVVAFRAGRQPYHRFRAGTDATLLVVGFDHPADVVAYRDGTVQTETGRRHLHRTPYFG